MSEKGNTPFTSLLTVPEWTGLQITGIINKHYDTLTSQAGLSPEQAKGASLLIAGQEAVSYVSGERNNNNEWVKGSTPSQPTYGELKAPQVYANKPPPEPGRGGGEMMA